MRTTLLTVVAIGLSTPLFAAKKPAVAPPPPLPEGGTAVVAVKPAAPKSPAIGFAERDVETLTAFAKRLTEKAKATKDKRAKAAAGKAATAAGAKLAKAQARLKVLSGKPAVKPDPKNMTLIDTFKHNRPMISCLFDASGRFVFAGAMDAALHRFDAVTGERTDFPGHESWIRRFDLHSESGALLTGSYAGRLFWWKLEDPGDSQKSPGSVPEPQRKVDAHKGYVRGVAVSPDGKLVATGGNDNMVRIWSAIDGKLIRELPGHARHVYNVRFDPSGKYLVSGDLMGVLKQWEVGTWKHVRDLDARVLTKYDKTFRADCGGIRGMDFSPSGKYLVVCGIGSVTNAFAGVGVPTAVLFDFATGKRLKVMLPAKKYRGTCWNVKWHPSGKFFVGVGGGNGMAWFWKPGSAKSFHAVKLSGCGYDVSFHPDGLRMAVATYNRAVAIYDLGPKALAKPRAAKKRKRRRK